MASLKTFIHKKTWIFSFLAFVFSLNAFAQQVSKTYYATLSEGVKLYESPSEHAKVLTTVTYGSKVTFNNSDADKLTMLDNSVVVNGARTYWMKVTHNNVKGYVIKDNLATIQPPKENTDKLSDWLKQFAQPFTNKWESGKIAESLSESEDDNYISRQIFQNGILLTVTSGYDVNSSETVQIPNTNIFAVYNLIQHIGSFKSVFKLNTALREGTSSFKDSEGNEYKWEVFYQKGEEIEDKALQSIVITWNNGNNNTLKISTLGNDIVVFYETTL